REANCGEHIYKWCDARLIANPLEVGSQAVFTLRLEPIVLLFLLCQPLNNSDRGKRLVGQGSQKTRAYPRGTRGDFDAVRVPKDPQNHERSCCQGNKGEPPIQPKHHYEHSDQQKCVTSQNDEAISDQVVNGLYV